MAEPDRRPANEEITPEFDRPQLRALEGGGQDDGIPSGNLQAVNGSDEQSDTNSLGAAERAFKFSQGGKEAQGWQKISRKIVGMSTFRKRMAIAGVVGGGGIAATVLAIFFMLPLKIESLVTDIQNHFAATTENAVGSETENLFDKYVINQVLPNIGGACYSTVSPACSAAKSAGNGPVSTLYNAWREDKLENKLATRYNIVFGKKGGTYYINTSAGSLNLGDHPASIFGGPDTVSGTRSQIRFALDDALNKETLWNRVLFRFRYGHFIEHKYGVKRCVIACDARDSFSDAYTTKRLAAKAYIVERVISPLNESYGLIIECLLNGGCDATTLNQATPEDNTRTTDFQRRLQAQLDSFAARYGTDSLEELVKKANAIGEDGFAKYFVRETVSKIAGRTTGDAASKAVPVVGWALLVSRLVGMGEELGPTVRYMSYAANAAAAVQLYEAYNSVTSEVHSGHMDATELGSFTTALSTNADGTSQDISDATQTPLYNALIGSSGSSGATASLTGLLAPSAFADSPTPTYTCNDGRPPAAGSIVCPEENLSRGNGAMDAISGFMNNTVGAIPGLNLLIGAVNKAASLFGTAFASAFGGACKIAGVPGTPLSCTHALNAIGGLASQLLSFLINTLVASPFNSSMSGGRTFDMMAAGGDVYYNTACRDELGCQQLSDGQVASVRNASSEHLKSSFNNQPLFARLFSTTSPYSLVSRLAVSMPSSLQSAATSGIASLLHNPIGTITSSLGSMLASGKASAAVQPAPDPFGITQYGYPTDDPVFTSDPETYWQNNCVNGPVATYNATTGTLDNSAWLNSQGQDQHTGEMLATTPNRCMLIKASVEAAGGMFDASLLPAGS